MCEEEAAGVLGPCRRARHSAGLTVCAFVGSSASWNAIVQGQASWKPAWEGPPHQTFPRDKKHRDAPGWWDALAYGIMALPLHPAALYVVDVGSKCLRVQPLATQMAGRSRCQGMLKISVSPLANWY